MKLEPVNTGLGHALICPACGGSYLHFRETWVYRRYREDSARGVAVLVHSDSSISIDDDMDGNPSPRRDGIAIKFECEGCDHRSEMKILQHKGQTLIEVV